MGYNTSHQLSDQISEQHREITRLRARIAELEQENAALRGDVCLFCGAKPVRTWSGGGTEYECGTTHHGGGEWVQGRADCAVRVEQHAKEASHE